MPGIGIGISPLIRRYSGPDTSPLGSIYQYSSFPNLNDFSNTSGNFSTDGTVITATKSGGTLFSSQLFYNKNGYSTQLEKWTQTGIYNVGSKDGFGLAIGCADGNPFCALLFLDTFPGRIRIFNATNGDLLAESNPLNDIVINNNDDIEFDVTDNKGTITATFTNLTTPGQISVPYSFPLTFPITQSQPVFFGPSLFAIGGTQTVTSWNFSSNARKGVIGAMGDSNFSGFFSTTEANRIPILAGVENVYAGPGSNTGNFYLPELLAMNQSKWVINLGTNDVMGGIPSGTSMTNLTNYITALEAAGSEVILCKIPPLDTHDVTLYNNLLVSTFGARVKVDLFTPFKNVGDTGFDPTYTPDGIHFNQMSQALAAALIAAQL
jgi:hypothetical protein